MSWDVYIGIRLREPRTPLATLASLGDQRWFEIQVLHRDYLRRAELKRRAPDGATLSPAVFAELRQLTSDLEPAAEGWFARPRFELEASATPDAGAPPDARAGASAAARLIPFEHRGILRCLTPGYRWPAIGAGGYDAVYDAGDHKHYSPASRGLAAERNLALLIEESASLLALGVRELRGLDAERSLDPGDAWLVYHSSADGYRHDLQRLGLAAPSLDDDAVLRAALEDETLRFEPTPSGPIIYAKAGLRGRLKALYERLSQAAL